MAVEAPAPRLQGGAAAGDRAGTTGTSMPHQPALDGLRGVAVLAVMLYHAGVDWARGGFLGVDAFFVLSGYLITTLLLREWGARRRVDLPAFWARRARRLLPALLLTLLAVAGYAAVLAEPAELQGIRRDGLATLAYVQNWQLIRSGQSYFEQFLTPSPLRHTWSLAIEEQWYLLWPLALVGLLVVAKRRPRSRADRPGDPGDGALSTRRRLGDETRRRPAGDDSAQLLSTALVVVVGLAAASAVWMAALHHPGQDPSRAYYGTDARAQSLLVGAALALVLLARPGPRRRTARAALQVAAVAAGAVLLATWARTADTAVGLYEGGFAALAVLVAVVIAAAVQPDRGPLRAALSVRPLQALGVISYGLYLWHWPIYLVLSPDRTGLRGSALVAVRLVATLAVAVASFLLVERPIRSGRLPGRQGWWALLGSSALVVAALLAATSPGRVGRDEAPPPTGELRPLDPEELAKARAEARAETPPDAITVVVAGDSVALTLGGTDTVDQSGVRLRADGTAVTFGCGVVDGSRVREDREDSPPAACALREQIWAQAVQVADPDLVVLLTGAWEVFDLRVDGEVVRAGSPAATRRLRAGLDRAREVLTARGARLVLLTTPCFRSIDKITGEPDARNDPARVEWVNRVLRDEAADHPDSVSVVDLYAFLCPGGRYTDVIDGVDMRTDGVHLTWAGSDVVWEWLDPRLRALAGEGRPGG